MATTGAEATSGIAAIEAASIATWPALETIAEGGWRARFSRGYSGRANAIWTLDASDDSGAQERLERFADHYRARGLPPMLRVTPLTPPRLVALAAARDWSVYGYSIVMAGAGHGDAEDARYEILAPTDRRWLPAKARFSDLSESDCETLRRMLPLMPEPSAGLLGASGAALVAVSGGIGLYYNVVVSAEARGRGEGRRLMGAAMAWAKRQGARHHALQVAGDNAPAIRLYRSLGFAETYAYHFLRASR